MTQRLGPPNPSRFPRLEPSHVRVLSPPELIGRIHFSAGVHGNRWNQFRRYGPTGSRFDHHPPPRREHPRRAVMYGGTPRPGIPADQAPLLQTAVLECFGAAGAVHLSEGAPYFVLFRPTRALRLLDVADSDWVARAGGNAAISSGPRAQARTWARAIYRHYTGEDAVDGLYYTTSSIPVARSVALWERAQDAMSPRPELYLPLNAPALRAELEVYAARLRLELLV